MGFINFYKLYKLNITLQSVFHNFEVSHENYSSECILPLFKNHILQNGCHIPYPLREEASSFQWFHNFS
jgi:hypothetical protein